MNLEMARLMQFAIPFLAVVAGSLLWAKENGHKPMKAFPVWVGFAVLGAVIYFLDQRSSSPPDYAEMLNHEAMLTTLAGGIIVAIVAALCVLFVLRTFIKHQSQSTSTEKRNGA